MDPTTALFVRYREHGDVAALGRVFDELAPRLLAVALHACGNAADAEDALQATFVIAMRKAGAFDAKQPIGGWLAGMLAGEARNLMRREQRRRGEPLVESAAADGDPSAASERRELVAQLRTHVEALPEEQRQVLLLQLQHGLQPAEIAEVLGVPPGTVRMRVHRGLAALRGMLPAGLAALLAAMLPSRGLAAVRAVVMQQAKAAGVVGAGVGGGAVLMLGGLLMKKLVVVAVLAVLGVFAWWSALVLREAGAVGEPQAAGPASPVAVEMQGRGWLDEPPAAARAAPARDAIEATPGRLQVIVRADAIERVGRRDRDWVAVGTAGSGVPLADVFVEVWCGAEAPDDVDARGVTGRTDAAGCCVFADLQAGEWHVALTTAGVHVGGDRIVVPAAAQATCELHLASPREVHGRVVDARDLPVAGAAIVVGRALDVAGSRTWRPRVAGVSGIDGSFRCCLVEHEALVAARKAGHAASWSHPVEQPGDGPVTLQLGDAPGALEVKVTDREGRAIPGTIVQVQSTNQTSRRLDSGELVAPPLGLVADELAPGRFVAGDLAAGCYSFFVTAPGRSAQSQLVVTAGVTASMPVTFGAGVTVTGRVRGVDGAALRGVHVSLERPGIDGSRTQHTDARGAFRFEGIAPGLASVTAVRLGTQARVTKQICIPADRGIDCDLELADAVAIRGRVVDAKGVGLPGYMVHGQQGDRSFSCFADGDGAFTVFDLAPVAATFRVSNRQSGEHVASLVVEVPRPGVPVQIVVPAAALPHAVLRGRIVRADGQAVTEPSAVLREQPPSCGPIAPGDGTFRFEGLARGQVSLLLEELGCAARTLQVQLEHGEQRDLGDLVLQPAGELRVRFLRPDGRPWRERPPLPRLIRVGGASCDVVDGVRVDVADGVVVMTGLGSGRYTVCGPADDDLLVASRVVDVAAGKPIEIVLPTAVGRQLHFCVEDSAAIASLVSATILVRRPDGTELARGEIAPAKQVLEARLLVPLGDAVAEVVADGRITHRSHVVIGLLLEDRGIRTIAPLAADDR